MSLLDLVAMAYGVTVASSSAIPTVSEGVVFRGIASEVEVLEYSAVWLTSSTKASLAKFLKLAKRMMEDQKAKASVAGTGAAGMVFAMPWVMASILNPGAAFT